MKEIPKCLIILRENAGEHWPSLKKIFIKFFDSQRSLLGNPHYKYFINLVRVDIQQTLHTYIMNNYRGEFSLWTYCLNVMKILTKEYRPDLVCYIQDSYNTCKSGNTKYPQFFPA